MFNTPGANANAVAELVLGALVLGSRNVAAGIRWADTLKGQASQMSDNFILCFFSCRQAKDHLTNGFSAYIPGICLQNIDRHLVL